MAPSNAIPDSTLTAGMRVGMVLIRESEVLGAEAYYHEFIAGAERILRPAGISVLLQVASDEVAEAEIYRRWAARGDVQVVFLGDTSNPDPRPALLASLRIAAVKVGTIISDAHLPTVFRDESAAMDVVVRMLAGNGHYRIGHVGGPARFEHSIARRSVLRERSAEMGISALTAEGDFSEKSGAEAALAMLSSAERPTAIIFDNDVMAIGGLRAAQQLGLNVPGDVSIVGWDDSALCQLSTPTITTFSHDIEGIGEAAGELALRPIADGRPRVIYVPGSDLIERASVGLAPIAVASDGDPQSTPLLSSNCELG